MKLANLSIPGAFPQVLEYLNDGHGKRQGKFNPQNRQQDKDADSNSQPQEQLAANVAYRYILDNRKNALRVCQSPNLTSAAVTRAVRRDSPLVTAITSSDLCAAIRLPIPAQSHGSTL